MALNFDQIVSLIEVSEELFEATINLDSEAIEIDVQQNVGEDVVNDLFIEDVEFVLSSIHNACDVAEEYLSLFDRECVIN